MKRASLLLLIFAIAATLIHTSKPASAEVEVSEVVDAILRSYCVEEYWENRGPPKPARTLPLAVRIEGETAYAWVEHLYQSRRGEVLNEFFAVETRNGRSAVTEDAGYDPNDELARPDLQVHHDLVFGGNVRTAELHVPSDCAQSFEGDSPLKQRMLSAIQRTMVNKLTEFNRDGPIYYSKRTRIVVGNFNRDSVGAFVFVPESGEVFEIIMHDPGDLLNDYLLERGEYPIVQVLRASVVARYRPRILAIGIEREIELGD